MKAKLYLSGLALMSLVACSDEMDYHEYVLNTIDYQAQTSGGVIGLAANTYNYMEVGYGMFNVIGNKFSSEGMICSATDEAECAYASQAVTGFTNGAWSATNTLSSRWKEDYTGIQCANNYCEFFQGYTFDDYKLNGSYDVEMMRYEKSFYEARAMRAYLYLDLVKNFGDVPYFTKTATINNVNGLTRTPALEVLDSIMQECDTLVKHVVVDYSALPGEGWGNKKTRRIDLYFVLALKARAALYAASPLFNPSNDLTRWEEAAKATKDLLDAAEKAGKTLEPDYAVLAGGFPGEKSKEVIFSREVNGFFQMSKPEEFNYPVGIVGAGKGVNCPSQTLVDAYEMAATGLGIDEAESGYDPENPYEGRDPRFYLTVAFNGDVWPTIYGDDAEYTLETYVGGKSGKPVTGATPTGYYLKKGLDGAIIDLRTGSTNAKISYHGWTIFRLGEFYLNYAEAVFMATGDANTAFDGGMTANDAVNKVRARAGMPAFPAELSGDDWMRKYKNERFVELAFEGHRFYDLRRWRGASDGIDAEHRMKSIDEMVITKNEDGTFSYKKQTVSRTWDNKMYFFPIPQSELMKTNGSLKQNTGW